MPNNSSVYLILWVLLQLLVEVNCQMTPFKPTIASSHTATLIDNKLYILGGVDINNNYVDKEFFYLDVSVPFNTQQLSWQDLSNTNILPSHSGAASCSGGANNNILFLYGGMSSDQTMALVYTFDSQNIKWSIPKFMAVNAIRKSELTGVCLNGIMYLWGGMSGDLFSNDMLILDTINLNWKEGSLIKAPTPRCQYGATLLPNNNIIYLGGNDENLTFDPKTLAIDNMGTALTLSEVYIYDTIHDNWTTKKAVGKIPPNRAGFSTVLGLDGLTVIIFGGYFNDPGYLDPALYVLDLTHFTWYVPKVSGIIPSPRVWHKANVIGKYMVISFGKGYDKTLESDILLLDISNNAEYVWTTDFNPSAQNMPMPNMPMPSMPSSPSQPSSSSSTQQSNNNSLIITPGGIIGAIIGSLFGGILLSFGIFFLYKYKKKQKQNGLLNDNTNNNNAQEELVIPNFSYGKQSEGVIQISGKENTTNHEPIIIPDAVIHRNYNHGQDVISTYNDRLSLQTFKDEMLQAVKQEINENLRNEMLQIVRQENSNITKDNTISKT